MMPLCTTATRPAPVRVGIALGGRAMGGPAGVANARLTPQRGMDEQVREVHQPDRTARGLFEPARRSRWRSAGAVVAAILQCRLRASTSRAAASLLLPEPPMIPHIPDAFRGWSLSSPADAGPSPCFGALPPSAGAPAQRAPARRRRRRSGPCGGLPRAGPRMDARPGRGAAWLKCRRHRAARARRGCGP